MSEKEEVVCAVCANFESQAWRKGLCKNCFHTRDEHQAAEKSSPKQIPGDEKRGPAQMVPAVTRREPAADRETGGGEAKAAPKEGETQMHRVKTMVVESSKYGRPAAGDKKSGAEVTRPGLFQIPKAAKAGDASPSRGVVGLVGRGKGLVGGTSVRSVVRTPSKEVLFPESGKGLKVSIGAGADKRNPVLVQVQVVQSGRRQQQQQQGGSKLSATTDGSRTPRSPTARAVTVVHSASEPDTSPANTGIAPAVRDVKRLAKSLSIEAADEPGDARSSGIALRQAKNGSSPAKSVQPDSPRAVGIKCQGEQQRAASSPKSRGVVTARASAKPNHASEVPAAKDGARGAPPSANAAREPDSEGESRRVITALQSQVSELEKKLSALEKKNTKLQEQVGEKETLREENRKLQEQVGEKETLREENRKLQEQVGEKETLREENRKLQEQVGEKETLWEENRKLQEQICEKETLREENRKLQEQICEKETLQEENRKLQEQICEKETLQEENRKLQEQAGEKETLQRSVGDVTKRLDKMEARCTELENERSTLAERLEEERARTVKEELEGRSLADLRRLLEESEESSRTLRDDNEQLQREVAELKVEMDEMYDQFRENDAEDFREMQKELEITAKNCRILQFKLRKAERRNEQLEAERERSEDKLRMLQNAVDSEDARIHIRAVEEELKMAKEVSVRLHDELDIVEEKRSRLEEENRKLQEILDQSDKKEFRMELELDRYRDKIESLENQLKQEKHSKMNGEPVQSKMMLGQMPKQGSSEYDVAQLMRDLYDSIERENDLKEQLRYTETEAKIMRRKLGDLEEENEGLNMQLQKMSSAKLRLSSQGVRSADFVELQVKFGLSEQELTTAKKKITELEKLSENLAEDAQTLQRKLAEKQQELITRPAPSSPDAYYEDKIKELTEQTDELKWKLIEKERDIERLSAHVTSYQTKQKVRLKKSRSLDSDPQVVDLRRQVEVGRQEAAALRLTLATLEEDKERLAGENHRLQLQASNWVPRVRADDAALENVELRRRVKTLKAENRKLNEKIRSLSERLRSLGTAREGSALRTKLGVEREDEKEAGGASGEEKGVPHIPSPGQGVSGESRDFREQLRLVEEEASGLRRKMAELEEENSRLARDLGRYKKAAAGSEEKAEEVGEMDESAPGHESREELMDKVLDLEEDKEDLLLVLRRMEETKTEQEKEVAFLKNELSQVRDTFRGKELQLLQELDMLHEKNDVLSNLLDIVNDRAESAEKELRKLVRSSSSSPSTRSASAISALSDASVGSDDVFLASSSLPTGGGDAVCTDWQDQFKKRIDCLERLLAEERQKLTAAEKKLQLSASETPASGMSDDVKLYMREKEILQHEVLENQKHLRIANDQISGLRERVEITEEENQRLRVDYDMLASELSKSETKENDDVAEDEPNEKMEEETSHMEEVARCEAEIAELTQECAKYKLKSEELEYKVDELNDIWRSKSAASEKEIEALQLKLKDRLLDLRSKEGKIQRFQKLLKEKDVHLAEKERILAEKDEAVKTRDEIMKEQEHMNQQRNDDFQTLLEQISNRDENIRDLREAVRNRDERLREKDDILQALNASVDRKQKEMVSLDSVVKESSKQLSEKDDELKRLRTHIIKIEGDKMPGETDEQKEEVALRNKFGELMQTVQKLGDDKALLSSELGSVLNDKETRWAEEREMLQSKVNTLTDKLRHLEKALSMNEKESVSVLRQDNQNMIEEKGRLSAELQRLLESRSDVNKILEEKQQQLDDLMLTNERLQQHISRLQVQATMAYRLQQEERVRIAEQLTMKIRYETKIEKLQRDYNALLSGAERLKKDRELQQDIIRGIQRGMSQLKAKYTQDTNRWREEKAVLEGQILKAEENQKLASNLRHRLEELELKMAGQERERAEMANQFATEKSSWEIERSNTQSKLNKFEEQLSMFHKARTKFEVGRSTVEMAWEKERNEQKRLLAQAHNLALDLQQQLKSRDEAYCKERKDLLNRMETERGAWERQKRAIENKIKELEPCEAKLENLQMLIKETQDNAEKEHVSCLSEKNDLLRRIVEHRQMQIMDAKKMEDVLRQLLRIKELVSMIEKNGNSVQTGSVGVVNANILSSTYLGTSIDQQDNDQQKLKGLQNQVAKQVVIATDDLCRYIENREERKEAEIQRSLSSSHLDHQGAITDEDAILGLISEPRLLAPGSTRSASSSPVHLDSHLPRQSPSSDKLPYPVLLSPFTRTMTQPSDLSDIPRTQSNIIISSHKTPRPCSLIKSISMDSSPIAVYPSSALQPDRCASAGGTPTRLSSAFDLTSTLTGAAPKTQLALSETDSTDKLSQKSLRRNFFGESPSLLGFFSWPDRRSRPQHVRQSSMPDPGEVRKIVEQEMGLKKRDASFPGSDNLTLFDSAQDLAQVESGATKEPETKSAAKDKRRLFKKSKSVDNSVSSSLAKVGVQVLQPGVSSGSKASDIFNAVKRRLRPVFKRSFTVDDTDYVEQETVGSSQLPSQPLMSEGVSIASGPRKPPFQTDAAKRTADQQPEDGLDSTTEVSKVRVPQTADVTVRRDILPREEIPKISSASDRQGRLLSSSRDNFKKWRSKSAERPDVAAPLVVHADIITPIRVWQFSETAV